MQPKVAVSFLLFAAALGALSCAEQHATGAPPSASTVKAAPADPSPTPPPAAALPASAPLAAEAPPVAAPRPTDDDRRWIEAVRAERWAEAEALIDALPEASRARPEVRFVRARVAIARRDHARAVSLLDGLAALLPMLAGEIARLRAEAAAEAGPFAEAAAYFERSGQARDLVRASEAYEKAGDVAAARRVIDRAVAAAQRGKSKRDEAAARIVRARLLAAAGLHVGSAADLKWIALNAPLASDRRAALGALDRANKPLTGAERLHAIDALVGIGQGDEALAELDRIAATGSVARAEVQHARAVMLFSARDYDAAAQAFLRAATSRSGREAEQLYYAGKALARSGREDEAVRRFRDVATRFGRTFWGERAAYMTGRILLQTGRYREAVAAHDRYLASYRRGDRRDEAQYERALALLLSKNPRTAKRAFAALANEATREEAGRLRQLEGVAALRAGDREGAIAIWTDVMRRHPLSWASQAARARLVSLGAPVPPLIAPAAPRSHTPLSLALPEPAALLTSIGLDGDAERWLVANERAAAARYAGRESEALCGLYGMLSGARRRYRIGLGAVSASTLERAPSDAERWAWECLYPRPYAASVAALEEQHGLPTGLIHAVMRQESMFDPAIVSSANAVGLMQLIPPTARQVAGELSLDYDPSLLTSPDTNLRLGAFYAAKLLRMFRGSVPLAAASYNAGPKAVSRWLDAAGETEVDLWVARIPYEETRKYVAKVMGNLARYQWLEGGDEAVMPVPLELPEGARASADAY